MNRLGVANSAQKTAKSKTSWSNWNRSGNRFWKACEAAKNSFNFMNEFPFYRSRIISVKEMTRR